MKVVVSIIALLLICYSVSGVPVVVDYYDTPRQDVLVLPDVQIHELGVVPFPQEELIEAGSQETSMVSCQADYISDGAPNIAVSMQNMTGRSWSSVWYVADPGTTLTNDDGLICDCLAFKIDAIGVNTPLVFESLKSDGVFEDGEIWTFVIQNYSNSIGLPADALASVGLVGSDSSGDQVSSGSIIVPEPISVISMTIGGLVLGFRKKFA